MNAEVFISYASKDRERILDLVDRLDAAGVSVWIDQMSIEGATMWSQEIVEAIDGCRVLILAISPNSSESENVVKEVALASERRKKILPVCLEMSGIPKSMEYQLAGIQRVEYFAGEEEAGLQAMIRALAKLGVTVSAEANTAAAGAPKRPSHGASHAPTNQAPKNEGAAWGKITAAVGGVAVLVAGLFFSAGGSSETTTPLGQAQTNATEQAKPLAKPATLDTNRVVVLPFKVIGSSKESENLAYALVTTLTSKLQPLDNLTVIANESAWQYEGSKLPPGEIGQALEVGMIVTGEIQTSSDKVQVNIRVIDANTAALGWGNTYSKAKDEFLDLQNEIATKLASELKGGLADAESQQLATKATANPKAQLEYQAGRREWNKRSKEGFDNAIKHFERAIELDPKYADPYAGLGDTYGLLPVYNFAKPDVAMPKAKAYAEQAIELNPNLAGAYTSRAWVQHTYEYNWAGAEASYKKAIQLNPNYATGHHWYGEFLYHIGNAELGFDHLSKAVELAPTSKIIKVNLSTCCWILGRDELALMYADKSLEIDPFFHLSLKTKYTRLDHDVPEDAIDKVLTAYNHYPNQPGFLQTLFNLYWKSNEREKAYECLIELLDKHHDTYQRTEFANIYFIMDRPEDAYRWMEKAIEQKESLVPHYATDPSLRKYQSEPRFRELYKKINHPMYVDE
tara:strand:+ start:1551 stop:3602 length:2052 start_codon:yes stop_codon:yes gene_type:complete